MSTVTIRDVPRDKLDFWHRWAEERNGSMQSFAEGDGEFTVIIHYPKN